jgi:hypothetical protein
MARPKKKIDVSPNSTPGNETVPQAKKKANANLRSTAPKKKQPQTQIVLTLAGSNGDVVKVERLEKSGERHEISDHELVVLVGDEDSEDIGTVLEEAYSAGLTDALDHEMDEEREEQEIFRRLKQAAGRQLLRRSVHGFILRRIFRRELQHRGSGQTTRGRIPH